MNTVPHIEYAKNDIGKLYELMGEALSGMERTTNYWKWLMEEWHNCNLEAMYSTVESNEHYRQLLESDLNSRVRDILDLFDYYRRCAEMYEAYDLADNS